MRINKTENIRGIYNANMNNSVRGIKKDTVKKDELKFSERAKDFQVAMEKIKELPDIREEKVERLKREVKTGIYKVEGRKIAEKMLENIGFDKKV